MVSMAVEAMMKTRVRGKLCHSQAPWEPGGVGATVGVKTSRLGREPNSSVSACMPG